MSDPGLDGVVGLLDDEHVRTILEATSVAARSAGELADRCEASRQTVYRRLEELESAELVEERTRVRKDGHHEAVYVATFERLSVSLTDGELAFEVDRKATDPSDRLTDLWRNF